MREIYEVTLSGPQLYEVSALLISTLAMPGVSETAPRLRLYDSLCASFIRWHVARDPEWASQPQWIRPDQACRREADIQKDMRTAERRLRDRLASGHLAIAYLQEAESGQTPVLPGDAKRLTLNQLVEHTNLGIPDVENITTRVWRPSLPVIHLCAAWATVAQEYHREHGRAMPLDDSTWTPEFLATIFYRAQLYEPLLERGRLKIAPESLVRFRVTGVGSN
jgi:hypothetical protein